MKTILTLFMRAALKHRLKIVWPGGECHMTLEYRPGDGILVIDVEHMNDVAVDAHVPSL